MKRLTAAAAAVLAVTIGLAVPGTAMASSTPTWIRVFQSGKSGFFESVAALSNRNTWAAAYLFQGNNADEPIYRPYVVHFNGSTWKPVTIPGARMEAISVQATSASNVWVFGLRSHDEGSAVYRWDGAHWHKIPVPRLIFFNGSTVLGPRNVWAFGLSAAEVPGDVYHWNGKNWKVYNLNFIPQSVSASSARNVWLTGMKPSGKALSPAVAYRWNGRRWRTVSTPHPLVDSGPSVLVTSRTNVWLGWDTTTRGRAAHWNGRKWTELTSPKGVPATGGQIAPDGRGGLWFGPLADWTGHAWIDTENEYPLNAGGSDDSVVSIPGTSSSLMAAGTINRGSNTEHPTIYQIDLG